MHFTFPIYLGYSDVELVKEFGVINLRKANFLLIEPSALFENNLLKNFTV